MNEVRFTLTENARLAPNVYRLRLAGDASAITAPGQFLELSIPDFFLRRPFSVCDWEDGSVTILYRAVGDGTRALAEMKPSQTIDALCGLGNGFDVTACGEKTLVIGGGIGVPPMYSLAKRLLAAGKTPAAILGFNTASEIFYKEEFEALDQMICTPCTVDINMYFKTPSYFNKTQTILAEIGLERPITKPDFDNGAKKYSDMFNANVWLDDTLVIDGSVHKYYSVLPRVEIGLRYLNMLYNNHQYKSITNRVDYKTEYNVNYFKG